MSEWKLVPVEPTAEMRAACREARAAEMGSDGVWAAMLYAAPPAPSAALRTGKDSLPVATPVVWIQRNHLKHAMAQPMFCRVEPTQRLPDFVPLFAAPPDHREVMRKALEALDDLTRHASSDGPDMKPHRRAADALRAALGDDK